MIQRSADPEYDAPRFQVGFEVADIESARAELIGRGGTPISEVVGADTSSSWANFRDPEGNVFEIKQRGVHQKTRDREGGWAAPATLTRSGRAANGPR